jgi:NAD(P)-dependent dehydrogenase (short-subunit alcohol dehydrogenase family)
LASSGHWPTSVRELAAAAVAAAGGQVDVVVNNAAELIEPAATSKVPASLVASALAVDVAAPFLLTGALVPAMVERGWAQS